MKRKTAIFIGIIGMLILLGSTAQIYRICRTEKLRKQAGDLLETGAYKQAELLYDSIGDEEKAAYCDALEKETLYQEGIQCLQAGDYDRARELFSSVSSYKDAAELLDACDWQTALALEDTNQLRKVRGVYLGLGDHPGCSAALEQMNGLLYKRAMELAQVFRLEEACEIWRELGDYEASELLLRRGERALAWASVPEGERLLEPENRYLKGTLENVYVCEQAYLVVPEKCSSDTRFFIYYPGGRNEEISIDYLLYYMMNPSPNTMALFLRRNGLHDMYAKTCEAIDLLEQAAAERGVFVCNLVTAGSSLGAYPAMHSVLPAYEEYGLKTDCVLSLDAGSDWLEEALLLDESECREAERIGTEFYLFESPWVGMNREGIRRMVNTGNKVTMVGCFFDDHVQISLDAMGMGVVDWAVGDRMQPCNPEIYTFTRLEPDNGPEQS